MFHFPILNYSNLQESTLRQYVEEYKTEYLDIINKILKLDYKDITWTNMVQQFIDINKNPKHLNLTLLEMKEFYESEEIRNVCSEISNDLSKWLLEQEQRKDIYLCYKYYYTNQYKQEKDSLTIEQNKYLENMMLDYSLKGMDLPDELFLELQEIMKKNIDYSTDFSQNMSNESYSKIMTKDELKGLPQEYMDDHQQEDGMYKVTLKYPDYIPIMEYGDNRMTRQEMHRQFKSRCIKENTPIIENVYGKTRPRLAEILGYKSYSDYALVTSMAETTENVNKFLYDLLKKVKPLLHSDMEKLQKLHTELGYTDTIQQYDIAYLSRILIERECEFKKVNLKQYFPVDTVINGALSIYMKLLGFTFTKVTDMDHTFWHKSVELYRVNSMNNNNMVGYFYLDLYPRDGKYSHAACFPFINKSQFCVPVATMACNFGEGYLDFDEVETFFHEFGHVMHHLSANCTIGTMASFSCESDFVETPSQMFEEWCYCEESLKLMSKDLPSDMIEKLNKSRSMLQGYHYARQLTFGIFDMTIHSSDYKVNIMTPAELFASVQKEVLELEVDMDTSEPASFGHLMSGYAAGYYGYAWSLVYAKDLFSVFKDNKLLDQELGMRFRDQVLSQGSLRKSMESIKIFLGREPSSDAFINSII